MSKDIDLVKEFDRLIAEGGIDLSGHHVELELRYDCERNFHKWRWYQGFHMESYYYCEICDLKDRTRFPPRL